MAEQANSTHSLLSELRRRHVVRTALGYAAVVFVLLQLGEIVLPAFFTPDEADGLIRLLVVGAVLLTPVVLMVAWVYEITPMGIRSMEELDRAAGFEPKGQTLSHRLAFLAVTLVAVGGASAWWWSTGEGVPAVSGLRTAGVFQGAMTTDADGPISSLAVLPLEDLSAEVGQEYFAPGMHEAVISALSDVDAVRVISRNSVMQYSQTGKSTPQVGQELNVDAVLEGSVLRAEGQVRISVQLIHAASDTQLWSESYVRDLRDVIALQLEVSQDIAAQIQNLVETRMGTGAPTRLAGVSPGEETPAEADAGPGDGAAERGQAVAAPDRPAGTSVAAATPASADESTQGEPVRVLYHASELSPEAQENLMQGRMILFDPTKQDKDEALEYFREVLSEDSTLVEGLSGMASVLLLQGMEESDVARLEEARRVAERAVRADEGSPVAHDVLAGVDAAMASLQGMATAEWTDISVPTTNMGRLTQERIAEFEVRRGESDRQLRLRAFTRLLVAGDLEDAEAMGEALLDDDVDEVILWEGMEQLRRLRRDPEGVWEIRVERAEVRGREPGPSLRALADGLKEQGEAGYWTWKVQEIEARQAAGAPVVLTSLATARLALGDRPGALEALGHAIERREPLVATLRFDPVWDRVRTDPEFKELMRNAWSRRPPPSPRTGRTPIR